MKKIKKLKDKLISYLKRVKEEKLVSKYIKENKIFIAYIIVNIFNAVLLRAVTIKSFWNIDIARDNEQKILILGAFGFLFKKNRSQVIYLSILSFILTFLCTVNSIYYTYYTSFASFSMLSLTQFIAPVGDAVVENVLQIKDLVYLIPLFIFYIYIFFNKKHYKEKYSIKRKRKENFTKTIVTGGITLLLFCITLTPLEISRFIKQWNKEYVVQRFGIYIYQVNDGITSLQPKINSMFGYDKALKNVRKYLKNKNSQLEYTKENEYTNLLKDKNIIVIHAESVQSFLFDTKFNGQEVTPNFKRLASEGIYFSNYYSQVSVGTSSDAELTFNTSLMPTKSGTAFVSYSDRTYESTPNKLKELGYYTFSMHGNTADYWNRRVMHENFGYERFYSKKDYDVTKENTIGLGINDEAFFDQSIEYLEDIAKKHEKYYGLLITLTNHTPFSETEKYGDFPVDLKETITNQNGEQEEVSYPYMEGTKLGNYFKSVHYADKAFGEFIDKFDEKGLLENTVIIIYGDHDARLSKSDYERLYNYDKENDDVLSSDDPNYVKFDDYSYELNRRVPFIIWSKDEKYSTEVPYVMGMYDAMPTLGNMLGFKNQYALGHDIFNIKDDNIVVFPNGNWVTDKVYYNAQKGEYLSLKNEAIDSNYIEEKTNYTDDLLDVSNDIIVFDIIKKEQNKK